MGLFDRKQKKKADFSNVQSGQSSSAPRREPPTRGGTSYIVKQGDTLSAIAQREYGNAGEWQRIFEANRDQIEDPDLIQPGQQLRIPDRDEQGGFR